MNTTILALDLGTNTGWAVRLKDGQIISDTEIEWTSPARGYHDGNKFFME